MTFGEMIRPELERMIAEIATRSMFYGNRIPKSVMDQFEIEVKQDSAGVLVPFWISVLERGRGKRRSNTDHGLWQKIYNWMERRNMFRSGTPEGRIREAKFITWYINKYGNKHFRSGVFVDIYTSAREKTIQAIDQKFALEIGRITTEVI